MCKKCKLVQLKNRYDLKYLFNQDYGYSSDLNKSMVSHLNSVVQSALKIRKLNKNDVVLDIASNDGTLLNLYPSNLNLIKVGIDPILPKYKNNYSKINYHVPTFFTAKQYFAKLKTKAKVITALSVFYDSPNPNKFLRDIKLVLDNEGLFILEQSDLLLMIKNISIDTICHEHLAYYSLKVLSSMLKKNKLKIYKHEYNKINGGSSILYISHLENNNYQTPLSFNKKLLNESKYFLDKKKTYDNFFKQANNNKDELLKLLKKLKNKKKIIHGFGASTKGNTMLQHFKIDSNYIDCIAEINQDKFNKLTPGTNIKIISEEKSIKMKPDYYLVLPWHFKQNIISRFKKSKLFKGIFIFPFPKLLLVNMRNKI